MPVVVPKTGSVLDRIHALNEKAAKEQNAAQKPNASKVKPVPQRLPAQNRVQEPFRQSPSPPPSRHAETLYAQKPVSRPSTPILTPTPSPATISTPTPIVLQPTTLPTAAPPTFDATSAGPPEGQRLVNFGRRETQRFEAPAGPKTDYAYEHHRRHSLSSFDTSFPPPLPAATDPVLKHPTPGINAASSEKILSRLKKFTEAEPGTPLAKFKRVDTKKVTNDAAATQARSSSAPSTPSNSAGTTIDTENATATLTLTIAPALKQDAASAEVVHHRVADIEAALHTNDPDGLTSMQPLKHISMSPLLSPSAQAAQIPGAFHFDLDQHEIPQSKPASQVATVLSTPLKVDTTVPTVPSVGSPQDIPPSLVSTAVLPYYEQPSPVTLLPSESDKHNEELTNVSSVLDAIVLDHRAALEDITARLAKELSKMSKDYDAADTANIIFAGNPAPATHVNPVPEDEMKVERHPVAAYQTFPDPHKAIATLAPKLKQDAGVLMDLMRQVKEVAKEWSVDLELIQAAADIHFSHHRARTLTRYAHLAPSPLFWTKPSTSTSEEMEKWMGWNEGYGIHWGFDGYGEKLDFHDVDILQLQEQVLLLLLSCESMLLNVEIGSRNALSSLRGLSEGLCSELYNDEDETEGVWIDFGNEQVEDDELSIIGLYE